MRVSVSWRHRIPGTTIVLAACLGVACVVVGVAASRERRKTAKQLNPARACKAAKASSSSVTAGGVCDSREAAEMFKRVQRDMGRTFGFVLSMPISAQLATEAELYKRSGSGARPIGLCDWEDGSITIYVQRGLPRACFYATLAHEYAHVWQKMDGFIRVGNFERCEGFAEWVSWVLTEMAGYDISREFDRGPFDPYGTGLRKFLALQEAVGVRKAADLARKNRFDLGFFRGNHGVSRQRAWNNGAGGPISRPH